MEKKSKNLEHNWKDVVLRLTSVQTVDQDSSSMELTTTGKMEVNADGVSIMYEESEATGFEGSKTTLVCKGNHWASIERCGAANSSLVIEKDKKHHCHYGTPYGDVTVGIYTHAIDNQINEKGGRLYLKYTVDINSSYISDNEIFIDI